MLIGIYLKHDLTDSLIASVKLIYHLKNYFKWGKKGINKKASLLSLKKLSQLRLFVYSFYLKVYLTNTLFLRVSEDFCYFKAGLIV